MTCTPKEQESDLYSPAEGVAYTTSKVTLSSSGFHGGWDYVSGGLGGCHNWWLNVGTSSTSIKPLTWNFDVKTTTTWSGGPGQILNIGGAPATFIACNESGSWALYLQQGTDVPDEGCVETQLQEGTTDV
ncbi:hypothetical protein FRB94_011237 [Tulasnella sp. JGI-2019a]|nr:hypothetical protein FRB94_011237 [Tulasnella sp. JGI-2019a]